MFGRQRTGSVLCRSCGRLVGVADAECLNCGARNPGLFGFAARLRNLGEDSGFGALILGLCILAFGLSLALDPQRIGFRGLNLLSPSLEAGMRMGSSGIYPVWEAGRWWTVLSAGWLHGSLLHIFFNLYWVRILVPQVAHLYGPGRTVILYTVGSIVGFLASSSAPVLIVSVLPAAAPLLKVFPGYAPFTLGASAALLGLWGALIYYGRRTGSTALSKWAWGYALYFLVFGFLVPGIDNWAHLGGFAGGYLTAWVLDPLKPERTNHVVIAIFCLLASVASIVVSLLVPVVLPGR
ncbi:MAG: rhomboid family intramembrane serine protease [Thermoanaerobaculia bacterium]|nr:rhomboid family intramembrane serine protease [Thermoanaerobaculia bacterium]